MLGAHTISGAAWVANALAFISPNENPAMTVVRSSITLLALSKNRRHQPRIPAPVDDRDDPDRLLVRRVGDKVLIARDVES